MAGWGRVSSSRGCPLRLDVTCPREAQVAVMEALHDAYNVPPFSFMFNAMRKPNELKPRTMYFAFPRKRRSTSRKPLQNAALPEARRSAPNKSATRRLPPPWCDIEWDEQ